MLEEGHLLILRLDLGRTEPQASGTTSRLREPQSLRQPPPPQGLRARAWKDNEALYLQTPPARGFPAPVEHKSNMSVSKR